MTSQGTLPLYTSDIQKDALSQLPASTGQAGRWPQPGLPHPLLSPHYPPPFLALWDGDIAGAQAGDPWPAEHPADLRLASQDSVHRFLRLPALLGFLKPPRPMPLEMWYTPLEGYKRDF